MISRRNFLAQMGVAASATTLATQVSIADEKKAEAKKPLFEISLAQWTINRELKSGKIDNLDFAKVAHDHGIFAIEYVNQFFMDKAKDEKYLTEMKKRADDHGVKQLILMCDREGNIGHPEKAERMKTVENHRKWVDAAKLLGCHSISRQRCERRVLERTSQIGGGRFGKTDGIRRPTGDQCDR